MPSLHHRLGQSISSSCDRTGARSISSVRDSQRGGQCHGHRVLGLAHRSRVATDMREVRHSLAWRRLPEVSFLVGDGLHAHGRSALLLAGSLGSVVDFANDTAAMGLALVFSHVEEAGQGRELDVVGGSELAWIDVFACGAGAATWLPLALRARAA